MLNFNDPVIMLMVLPFIITVIGHGLFRYIVGEGLGNTLANASLTIAFLITMIVYYGLPNLPIRIGTDQLLVICLISLSVGFLQDRYPKIRFLSPIGHMAFMILAVFWIYSNHNIFPMERSDLFSLAFITIITVSLFLKLEDTQDMGLQAPVSLLWASVGLFVISRNAPIPLTENLMMILISALGAYLILNFPYPKFPFGASALYPGYLIILFMAMEMVNIDPRLALPVLVLIGVFFTENIINILPKDYASPFIRLILPAGPIALAWILS
jgi:hypothetical protein